MKIVRIAKKYIISERRIVKLNRISEVVYFSAVLDTTYFMWYLRALSIVARTLLDGHNEVI